MNRRRLSLATALLATGLVTLSAIVAATFWLSYRAQQHAEGLTSLRAMRIWAVELRNSLLEAESSQRGYLYTRNEVYLAPYGGAKTRAKLAAVELEQAIATNPQFSDVVDRLESLLEEKVEEMEESIAMVRTGRSDEALDMFLTNRGKSLMDQANLFATGIIESADRLLADRVREQTSNVELLRGMSVIGAMLIVLVVAAAVDVFRRTTREVVAARDEVRATNENLEKRVEDRTLALKNALDRSELLLAEVNHRVSNSLALVASLVRLQGGAHKDASVKTALNETHSRIIAISSVHKRLYASGDVGLVALDEYLSGLLDGLASTMKAEGRSGTLTYDLAPIKLPPDASVNLGIVITELVTNAYKYAYPAVPGDIRVAMRPVAERRIEVVVEDDGVGRGDAAPKGTGLGSRIVRAMAGNLGTDIEYTDRNPGTSARLSLMIPDIAVSA